MLSWVHAATFLVERPTVFDLVTNLKTAQEIKLRMTQSVILRASRVIE